MVYIMRKVVTGEVTVLEVSQKRNFMSILNPLSMGPWGDKHVPQEGRWLVLVDGEWVITENHRGILEVMTTKSQDIWFAIRLPQRRLFIRSSPIHITGK